MKLSRAKRKTSKGKKMSEVIATAVTLPSETLISKGDIKNEGVLEIRAENGAAGRLEVYFRHPVLAEVVAKMGMGNYNADQFDKVYTPCLMAHPDPKAKGRVVSRPAIYNSTKNFVAAADFDFTQAPRGVLIANPDALRAGYSLFIELKQPVPHDTLRKWGKQLMDGCADIIAASRPFTMQWVMTESVPGKL
jgi:hypothetical protein